MSHLNINTSHALRKKRKKKEKKKKKKRVFKRFDYTPGYASIKEVGVGICVLQFSVCVNEGQGKHTTMYWLPKLHKRPHKARFIANSSSCTTTELSKLLTSCLTAIKSHVIRYCETVYETATSLSTYDFSTLYTTLPHNLIKEKLLDLIEWTFKRALKTMFHFIWHVMTERLFSLPLTKVGIHFGHVRMFATPYPISLIIFILDLGPSYTDKLLEFRWVQIAHLS